MPPTVTLTLPAADLPDGERTYLDVTTHLAQVLELAETIGLHPHAVALDTHWDGHRLVLVDDLDAHLGRWGVLMVNAETGRLDAAYLTDAGRDITIRGGSAMLLDYLVKTTAPAPQPR